MIKFHSFTLKIHKIELNFSKKKNYNKKEDRSPVHCHFCVAKTTYVSPHRRPCFELSKSFLLSILSIQTH